MTADEIAESGPTWEPILFAYGGTESSGAVSGQETIDVDVSGLTVDGRDTQPDAWRKVGSFFRNVGGNRGWSRVADTTVERMGLGGKVTMGILANGDSAVQVRDNVVTDCERGAIGANGDGGVHPSPTLQVRNNHIDCNSAPGVGWDPNGVQIGYGAAGDVKGNRIENCRYAENLEDSFWTASGVLVFESDGVTVQGNTFRNNDVAAAASAWAWSLDSTDGTRILHNDVQESLIGVHLRGMVFASFSKTDPSVSNTKVVNNTVRDTSGAPDGAIGVAIEARDMDGSGGYTPILENNKVVRNTISGFDQRVVDGGTETKAHANVIQP